LVNVRVAIGGRRGRFG